MKFTWTPSVVSNLLGYRDAVASIIYDIQEAKEKERSANNTAWENNIQEAFNMLDLFGFDLENIWIHDDSGNIPFNRIIFDNFSLICGEAQARDLMSKDYHLFDFDSEFLLHLCNNEAEKWEASDNADFYDFLGYYGQALYATIHALMIEYIITFQMKQPIKEAIPVPQQVMTEYCEIVKPGDWVLLSPSLDEKNYSPGLLLATKRINASNKMSLILTMNRNEDWYCFVEKDKWRIKMLGSHHILKEELEKHYQNYSKNPKNMKIPYSAFSEVADRRDEVAELWLTGMPLDRVLKQLNVKTTKEHEALVYG